MRKALALSLLILVACSFVLGADHAQCGCYVEVYFTNPLDEEVGQAESVIINAINSAQSSIAVAMYWFTDDEIGDAVVEASNSVKVRVLLDDGQDSRKQNRQWFKLDNAEKVEVKTEHVSGKLHHKFVVIDKKLVITGSYNWSEAANEDNFENVIFIRCPEITDAYLAEFNDIWNAIGSE